MMLKDDEISRLKEELDVTRRQVKLMMNQELNEKNDEIKKLQNLIETLQVERNSIGVGRFSLEQLSDSFNDLKFQQAMEVKRQSQQMIEALICELVKTADSKTKEHIMRLQQQMTIVVEKQEVTDTALGKCAELCIFTMDHLNELAAFLKALLEQKEIRDSLSETTLFNIQSTLSKTLDLTNQAGRFSVDGRLSSLPDISSLDILMTTARNSLAYIKEISSSNKSVQVSNDIGVEDMENEIEVARKDLEDINRVNQVLEDEIYQLKTMMEDYKQKMSERDSEISNLKAVKDEVNKKLRKSQRKTEDLEDDCKKFQDQLQAETMLKFDFQDKAEKSESLAKSLQERLNVISNDLGSNWISKDQHDTR